MAQIQQSPVLKNLKEKVYPTQKLAANRVFQQWATTDCRETLLKASVQSGKSGCYQYLIYMMFTHNLIDNAYIICGSNEKELLSQCETDVDKYHSDKEYHSRIKVIFRNNNFKNDVMEKTRALYIIDETHLVADDDQTLARFLGRHTISLGGTRPHMIEREMYVLTVDATPYAEESAIIYKDLDGEKNIVVLQSGANYYGPHDYLRDGKIQKGNELFNLTREDGTHNFVKALREGAVNKYVLIRVQRNNKQYIKMKSILDTEVRSGRINLLYYTSEYDKHKQQIAITRNEQDAYINKYGQLIHCLEDEPDKTTVVLIIGRLRCGKRVPKRHIAWVWETSTSAKTDTILQGLIGRMCGYLDVDGNDVYKISLILENRPILYIASLTLKTNDKKNITMSDFERAVIPYIDPITKVESQVLPRLAAHIIPSNVANRSVKESVELYQCPPIAIQLSAEQIATLISHETDTRGTKILCINSMLTRTFRETIMSHTRLTREQKDEILLDWLDTLNKNTDLRKYHIRNMKKDSHREGEYSNQHYHKQLYIAEQTTTTTLEHMDGYSFLTFCVTYPDFVSMDPILYPPTPGKVYLVYYTKAKGLFTAITKTSRIPKHDGRTHFSMRIHPEVSDLRMGGAYGFSTQIAINSERFKTELDKFIGDSLGGIGVYSRNLGLLDSSKLVILGFDTYGKKLEKFHEIISNLNEKHGVKIKHVCERVRLGYKFISVNW